MVIINLIMLSGLLFAGEGHQHKHSHQHAHVHGKAELKIAFDGLNGKMEFTSPSESIVGFERKAKTDAEKKLLSEMTNLFEKNMNDLVLLESSLGCVIKNIKAEMHIEGSHADFDADYEVNCQKSPRGSTIKFDFTRLKKMNELEVTILVDDLQKSATGKKKPFEIKL